VASAILACNIMQRRKQNVTFDSRLKTQVRACQHVTSVTTMILASQEFTSITEKLAIGLTLTLVITSSYHLRLLPKKQDHSFFEFLVRKILS
jgi:hypothetical protein